MRHMDEDAPSGEPADGHEPPQDVSRHIKERVRSRYGALARAAGRRAAAAGCCGGVPPAEGGSGDRGDSASRSCCGGGVSKADPVSGTFYDRAVVGGLPAGVAGFSLGCGNPTALVELVPGEVVLDLGSGGGLDVFLAARRVGPAGKVCGLDMTDEMLALARENKRQAGIDNVEFLKGDIEDIPLPDGSVDVIISNCVINLAADKSRVFSEALRVLRPGGRFAVVDTVFQGDKALIPKSMMEDTLSWCQCVTGALEEGEYLAGLRGAGFVDESLKVIQVYEAGVLPAGVQLTSGFVRARKPGAGPVHERPATSRDLPSARRLLTESGLPLDGLEDQFEDGFAVAAARGVSGGDCVVGLAGLEAYGRHGLLRSVAVDPAWRGRGVASALVSSKLDRARAAGLEAVWLLTDTAPDYFPRFGFERVDRAEAPAGIDSSPEFAGACPLTATLMVARFAAAPRA